MGLLEFETCKRRVYRGHSHRKAFTEAWNRLVEEHSFYGTSHEIDSSGTGFISAYPVADFPAELGLELGEMLYQYRAALDACIYASAVLESGKRPPPNEHQLEFPFTFSSDAFEKAATRKIAPLPDDLRAFIESVQHYKIPKD